MTLDIRGSLKNTRKSKNTHVVLDELLANSIDAFLIRRASTKGSLALEVRLSITAKSADLLGNLYEIEIDCTDNGCGLGPEQLKAFLTKDTSYKDDLNISGIGNCKGSGRVQYFHHFSTLSASSVYLDSGKLFQIDLAPQTDRKEIDENDFSIKECHNKKIGTRINLSNTLPKIKETIFTVSNVNDWFNANSVKQYVLFSLLQRFVSLKSVLGNFNIEFRSDLAGVKSQAILQASDIPNFTSTTTLVATHVEEDERVSAEFTVTHYKLDAKRYNLRQNTVGLCAKSAIAERITGRYLKTKHLANNAIDGYFHIILVEGALFDQGVNEQRDGFDKIPSDNSSRDLFDEPQVTFEDIYTVLDEKVLKLITPPNWSRDKIVSDVGHNYGVSEAMLSHSNTRVTFGDTAITVAKRALKNLQEKVIDETTSLLTMKEALKELEPDSEDFRRKIDDLSWQFAASLKTVDMANLSQLVVRRSNLVDVLDMAVNQSLNIQADLPKGQRRNNEALIHSIFFPMRKDSCEVSDHDVWLLSEEYHYYDYIASDKPLSQIKWDGGKLFDDDIDDKISLLLERIGDENGACRPDIALFHEEGSVVIVEFKAPGVSLDEHDNDLIEYATLLAAKSKGRLKKFYGYLIGDTINVNRLRDYNRLPGANGFFSTTDVKEPSTQYTVGQLYSELLFYEDIVDRARKRIGVYRDRLKLPNT